MHEMESTGTPAPPALPPLSPFDDEDARGLAQTFTSMTAAIARFQQEATQRERLSSLGRLSTVIAHEVRNPLMIIKTALRSLRRTTGEDERVTTAIADIDEEVARLNRLVNDVLDFAKPIRFDIAPADLAAICQGAALAAMADGAPPRVDVRVPAGPVVIETDAERVRAALVNLLVNARQSVASPGGGASAAELPPVILEADSATATQVIVVVRDRGAGIAASDLPRIFDPFFTTRRTGSGLGLAIVRNVIEGLGGHITVDSRVSEGTAVTIALPRRHDATATTEPA
jgi:signal transduction histidine kinase